MRLSVSFFCLELKCELCVGICFPLNFIVSVVFNFFGMPNLPLRFVRCFSQFRTSSTLTHHQKLRSIGLQAIEIKRGYWNIWFEKTKQEKKKVYIPYRVLKESRFIKFIFTLKILISPAKLFGYQSAPRSNKKTK